MWVPKTLQNATCPTHLATKCTRTKFQGTSLILDLSPELSMVTPLQEIPNNLFQSASKRHACRSHPAMAKGPRVPQQKIIMKIYTNIVEPFWFLYTDSDRDHVNLLPIYHCPKYMVVLFHIYIYISNISMVDVEC